MKYDCELRISFEATQIWEGEGTFGLPLAQ